MDWGGIGAVRKVEGRATYIWLDWPSLLEGGWVRKFNFYICRCLVTMHHLYLLKEI